MSSRGNCKALSEAVARAARERSEQERETQPRTATRWHLPAGALDPLILSDELGPVAADLKVEVAR